VPLVDKVVAVHDALRSGGIAHAFGGAIALGYHAQPRGTREIDLNVFLRPSELERVLVHLAPLGVERPSETTGPRIPVVGIMCPWDETHIDLFFAYDDEFFDSVRSRIEEHLFIVRDVEHRLPILSAEDLTVFKVTFDRPKDWVDIRHMLEEKALDRDYVQSWLLHLRGDHEWPRIRRFLDLCEEMRPESEGPVTGDQQS
jgi:hypothetical protein